MLGTDVLYQNRVIDPTREKKVNIFLFFVYVGSVFIDIYNGYVQNIRGTETIIPILYKGIILVYGLQFIFKDSKVLLCFNIFFLLLALCIIHWGSGGYASLDLFLAKDLTKLIYPFVVLAFLYVNKDVVAPKRLLQYNVLYALIASMSIIITSVLGIGVVSYGETYGYGTKGLFIAGNDLSVILIIVNCIVSYFISVENSFRYIILSIIITVACMMIGSTAGIIGAISNAIFLIMQSVFIRRRISKLSKRFCAFMIVIGLPILGLWVHKIITTDNYTLAKFSVERLASGGARNFLEEAFDQTTDQFSCGDWMFGVGEHQLQNRIGEVLGTHPHMVELDQYDIVGNYGLLLGGIILLLPIVYLFRYLVNWMCYKIVFCYWISLALGLFVIHGLTAGHAYMNMQGMTVVMTILFLFQYRRGLM